LSPTPLLPQSDHYRPFVVLKVEIHSETSQISDSTRDRQKFTTRSIHYPTKHVPERVPELEKSWKLCINSGWEYVKGGKYY
jgi:hypothetical protein